MQSISSPKAVIQDDEGRLRSTLGVMDGPASELDYWRREGLDALVALRDEPDETDAFHSTSGVTTEPYAPKIADLVRLHRWVRSRMSQTVLEFGVGYSTVVLADALAKNERDYDALPDRPQLRNRRPFRLFGVDSSEHWIEQARSRIPAELARRVEITHSKLVAGTFMDRLCHYYVTLPNVVPDFIYLDAPLPKHVEGSVNGLDFSIDERTPMSADIPMMEPSLLPGAFIVVDGRTNNARFIARNLQRPFRCVHDAEADVTTFELDEPPLGRRSIDLAALVSRSRARP